MLAGDLFRNIRKLFSSSEKGFAVPTSIFLSISASEIN